MRTLCTVFSDGTITLKIHFYENENMAVYLSSKGSVIGMDLIFKDL